MEGLIMLTDTNLTPYFESQVNELINNIDIMVENGTFQFKLAELLLGDNATIDSIKEVSDEIKKTDLNSLSIVESTTDDEGLTLVGAALGVTKHNAEKLIQTPKSAKVIFRALRDKLEESENRAKRARAEEGGLISTIIYTIKQAMTWLVNKFKDLKDYISDSIHDREYGTSQAKRDYVWLLNRNVDYMSNNAKWW